MADDKGRLDITAITPNDVKRCMTAMKLHTKAALDDWVTVEIESVHRLCGMFSIL